MYQKPNILLIMPDQMRGDCLSLENHPVLKTPVMDAIGRGGAHFSRAYSTCPSCIPARRSLLTGQFPSTNGMVGYKEGLSIETPTLPQLLLDNGYATTLVGRYMHQWPKDEPYGFETQVLGSTYIIDDEYAGYLEKHAPDLGGIRGIGISCNGREAKPWPIDERHHPTTWVVQKSREQLAKSDERPQFLVTSFYAPHPPLFPPKEYMDHYLDLDLPAASVGDWETAPSEDLYRENVDSNRVALKGEELRKTQAGYFGLIKHIDDQLKNLITDFKAKSEAAKRPWLILLTSDHGELLGDHYLFRKCEPYEGSARVPFLIQGSKELGFKESIQCDSPVSLEDIMPTFLKLAGIPTPEGIDGKSLLPILRGEASSVRDILHGEHATCYDAGQAYHMLTNGRMKYIWRPADGTEELFNLEEDPGERHDLSAVTDHVCSWREQLIKHLVDRPEGFSDGNSLIPGQPYPPVLTGS